MIHRTAMLLLMLMTVLLASAGCDIDMPSEPLDCSEVIGVYQPNYETGGKESIVLRADSTYAHYYVSPDGRRYADSGRWVFIYELGVKNRPRVIFEAFVDHYPLYLNCYSNDAKAQLPTTPRRWVPYIKKLKSGGIRIERCSNAQQYYNKIQ
jgi:hypothetical protein